MSLIIDGTSGITFPNSTVQASAGQVLQVVKSTYTNATTTTSTSFVTTGISVTITPKFSTSKILVLHQGMINSQGSSNWADYTLYRNSTNLYTNGRSSAGGLYVNGSADYHATTGIVCLDNPATTSATTYTVYFKTGNGSISVRYNSDSWLLNIVAMEIAS